LEGDLAMNQLYRSQIENYLKSVAVKSVDDLYFCEDYYDEGIIDCSKQLKITGAISLTTAIYNCLELATKYYSYSKPFDVETEMGAARSSLDIWRHIKTYNPDITISDVINTMYKMENLLVGHYCDGIRRRVFKLQENELGWDFLMKDEKDEYNLIWKDWENV
jgi:hypothetical protein